MMTKKIIQRNWWIFLILMGCIFAYFKRYADFSVAIVSNPDSTILFSADQHCIEQTWQPNVKKINGLSIPYTVQKEFMCDIQLTIFSDDYSQELLQEVREFDFAKQTHGAIEFVFDKVNVIPGERYHIQLDFQNVEGSGSLELPTGSNYGGGLIGEERINAALAMDIGAVKYSKIFWLMAVLFPLSSISLLLMVLFRKKWEETVAGALVIKGIILYLFGFSGHIKWGINAVCFLSVIALGISAYVINRKKTDLKELMSPGFCIFWVVIALIVIANRNVWYGRFDEYSHWGLAVKDMFYYDTYAKHMNTTVLLPRYLPFVTLIEYYFVYFNGMYVESIVYIAFQIIMLCFSMILCSLVQKKSAVIFPAVLGMICIPIVFYYDISNCIYVDPLLGFVFMYVLICYFTKKDTAFSQFQIILGLIALVLIKDMGIVLAGLAGTAFMADKVWHNIKTHQKVFRQLLFPTACVAVTLLTWISWQIFMSIPISVKEEIAVADKVTVSQIDETADSQTVVQNVSFQGTVEASGLSINGIVDLITGNGSDDQKQIIKNAVVTVFDNDMYYAGNIGFSYIDIIAGCALMTGFLVLLGFWRQEHEKMLHLITLISTVGIIYCGVLCIMYLFAFSVSEALKLKSMDRYLASFLMAEVMIIWYCILDELSHRISNKGKVKIISLLLSGVLIIVLPIKNLVVKNMDRSITADMVYWYEETEEIFRSFAKRGEYSAFECANGVAAGAESYFIFRNAVSPLIAPRSYLNIVSSVEMATGQCQWYLETGIDTSIRAAVVEVEEWTSYLAGCDYLFILHADDFFVNSYQSVFEQPETICNGSIYQVVKEDGNISLMYIGETGVKSYK